MSAVTALAKGTTDIEACSAPMPTSCSTMYARASRRRRCTCRGRISSIASSPSSDRSAPVMRSLQQLFDHGRLAGTGYLSILPVDQGIEHCAGASFAKNPADVRSGEHRQARHRRRLQRGGFDPRRAGRLRAQVRAQDSVPAQVQPQRVSHLPEQVRPDLLRQHQAGARHGCGRGRRHHLLRLGGVRAADRGSEQGVRDGARDGHGHRAVVLSAQHRVQDRTRTTTCRPT